ncbi:hypothetical protein, partial [Acinetobacter indicus]|uniref:hypothetical protein n=1 Tax=Acinetobacter indicus TaxID=756892 RepID=UPI001444925F
MQASEAAGEKIAQAITELEKKKEQSIQEWADKAKDKLSNSSEDAQLEGQDLIEGFANQRTEDLKECTDRIISQLEQLQEKANATAERYHQPMNTLIEQVGKCSELKANDFKGLSSCAAEIRKDFAPLLSAPSQLASVKVQIVKAGIQNLQKEACVASTLAKFRQEATRVNQQIDQLIAEDK